MYFALLMQDTIELSANTARRAHAAVLQEMKRGKLSWADPNLVEKVKVRNTQRIFDKPRSSKCRLFTLRLPQLLPHL